MTYIKHGCRRTKLYGIWCGMKQRCCNSKNNNVEYCIKSHIKCLDKAIERAKKYKMLKHFFKEDNNDR